MKSFNLEEARLFNEIFKKAKDFLRKSKNCIILLDLIKSDFPEAKITVVTGAIWIAMAEVVKEGKASNSEVGIRGLRLVVNG